MSEIKHYTGHRERLRKRLAESSVGSLPDYEILELLLQFTIPIKDTKPIAKDLLKKFGSFSKVIHADTHELLKIRDIGQRVIASFRIIQESSYHILKENISDKPIISSWAALLDYCRATLGHANIEQFKVLYLNKNNVLIEDNLMQKGTIDQVSIYPREIAKKSLMLQASAIILIHNHPSGNASPSKADIEVTNLIIKALEPFSIKVHDHIIITNSDHYSFKNNALI